MFQATASPASTSVDEHAFRRALGHFASGITIITTLDPAGKVHGMTATAFSSLSMQPPLVLIAIAEGTRCHRHIIAGRRFGVSFLHAHQADLSKHFGGKPSATIEPRFKTFGGMPVLDEAMATLACTMESAPIAGGDHSIFIGRVTDADVQGGEPLVHFSGAYRTLASQP